MSTHNHWVHIKNYWGILHFSQCGVSYTHSTSHWGLTTLQELCGSCTGQSRFEGHPSRWRPGLDLGKGSCWCGVRISTVEGVSLSWLCLCLSRAPQCITSHLCDSHGSWKCCFWSMCVSWCPCHHLSPNLQWAPLLRVSLPLPLTLNHNLTFCPRLHHTPLCCNDNGFQTFWTTIQ